MNKIFLTEGQFKRIIKEELKSSAPEKVAVDPKKVLYVKKFLDTNFKRGTYGNFSGNGDWNNSNIVAQVDPKTGEPVRNMTLSDLLLYLNSKFNEEKHLFGDKKTCERFLELVMNKWYSRDIDRLGLIKGNNSF